MFKIIAIIVAVLIVVVLGYAASKPDTFRTERSITINAPAEKIFPYINDYHQWTVWSPYEKKDPNMKRSYGGAESGKGATYSWEGNRNIGSGTMEITESTPPSKILVKLTFLAPFEGHNTAEFTLAPQGEATAVTWAMYGPMTFIPKLMGVFFNMDKMVGNDFDDGLAALKAAAEKQ